MNLVLLKEMYVKNQYLFEGLTSCLIQIQELEQLEKRCEQQYNDACAAVNLSTSEGQADEEVNQLASIKDQQHFNLLLTGFVVEKASDKRDEMMKKDLRKFH